jgi:predicted negative regulator of RcsB-dependent stress response
MIKLKIIVLLLALLVIGLTSNAQDTIQHVNTSLVYHDIKSAITTNSPKIEKAIGILAKDLSVTADKLWDILVKQQRVYSICFLLLTLSALVNWYLWYKHNYTSLKEGQYTKGIKKEPIEIPNPEFDPRASEYSPAIKKQKTVLSRELFIETEVILSLDSTVKTNYKWLHLIICIGLSVLSYYHFSQMLTGFINPEFGAMQTIAEVAKQLK